MPEEVAASEATHEHWFADVTKKGFAPPRIVIGSEKENPVRLSRQDWRGPKAGWTPQSEGHWKTEVAESGVYEFTILSRSEFTDGGFVAKGTLPDGDKTEREAKFGPVMPVKSKSFRVAFFKGTKLEVSAWVMSGNQRRGADYVEARYLGAVERK